MPIHAQDRSGLFCSTRVGRLKKSHFFVELSCARFPWYSSYLLFFFIISPAPQLYIKKHNQNLPSIVLAQMAVISGTEGPAFAVASGDDTVSIYTLKNGTLDSIKLELELLSTVGEVGVA